MRLVVFGLSLTSSWGNGHATTYRALLRASRARGSEITFYEWDAPWYRGEHRDLPDPSFCRLVLYDRWEEVRSAALAEADAADGVIVGSYVHRGPELIDDILEAGIPLHFYDIDTPVTVAGLRRGEEESIRRDQIPRLASYLSFTGGPWLGEVLEGEMGAARALPLYCSVDRDAYRPVEPDPELAAEIAYMGTYAPDRQPTLERLLLEPARAYPDQRFLVAGPQYPEEVRWPANVRHLPHLPPARHAAFYSSARWQLNVTRADMIAAGWSPSVRLFEAAACGAPLISDRWPGIESFLAPDREILIPADGAEVREILGSYGDEARLAIGAAARARVLGEHTSEHRARELEEIILGAVRAEARKSASV